MEETRMPVLPGAGDAKMRRQEQRFGGKWTVLWRNPNLAQGMKKCH
jgi:hypothetical protein